MARWAEGRCQASRLRERAPGWTSISSNASLRQQELQEAESVQDCPAPPNIQRDTG